MTNNQRDSLLMAVAMALLLFSLWVISSSCSSAVNLKKAERQIKKAEQKGATWSTDSTFKWIKLKSDPIKVKFESKPIVHNDTIYFSKDRVTTKVLIHHDTIQAETDCPETVKEIKVPVTVYKTIKAKIPITWQDFIIGLIIAFLVGYALKWIKG